jgi:hypothetical protein
MLPPCHYELSLGAGLGEFAGMPIFSGNIGIVRGTPSTAFGAVCHLTMWTDLFM